MENREELSRQILEVAEVAGYLWQKGWAERNGGNISINITALVDDEIRNMPAIAEPVAIGKVLPNLKDNYFFCKGNNRRMRDLARWPMENGSVIRISASGDSYVIIADNPVRPTSELSSHLSMHNYLVGNGSGYKAVLHTHPIDLIAMTHHRPFLEKDVLTYLLWSMIPETRAFCPKGLGIIPYTMPSTMELADATVKGLADYDVVMWEKHGACAVSENIMEAFDMVDTLSKAAQIYMTAQAMGFKPEGTSMADMEALKVAFNLAR